MKLTKKNVKDLNDGKVITKYINRNRVYFRYDDYMFLCAGYDDDGKEKEVVFSFIRYGCSWQRFRGDYSDYSYTHAGWLWRAAADASLEIETLLSKEN